MVKQRTFGPDSMDPTEDSSSAFIDALRTRALDEMHVAALEYGIILKDLGAVSCTILNTKFLCTNSNANSCHQ